MSQNPFNPDEVPEWFQDLPLDIQQMLVELGVAPAEWVSEQNFAGAAPDWVQQMRLTGYFGFLSPAGLAPLYAGGMFTRAFTAGWLTPYGLDPGGYGYQARYQAALQTAAGYGGRAWGDLGYSISQQSLWQARAAYYNFQQNFTPIQEAWSAIRIGSYFNPELWTIRALGFPFYSAGQQIAAGAAMAPYVQAAYAADPTNVMQKIITGGTYQGTPFGPSPTFWPGQMPDLTSSLISGLGEWTGLQVAGWFLLGGVTRANAGGMLGVSFLQAGMGIGMAPLATLSVRQMWGIPLTPPEQQSFIEQEVIGWGLAGAGLYMALKNSAFASRMGGTPSGWGSVSWEATGYFESGSVRGAWGPQTWGLVKGSRIMSSAGQAMFPSLAYARQTVGLAILDEMGISSMSSLSQFNERQIMQYVETPLRGITRKLLSKGMVPTNSNAYGPGLRGVWYRNPVTGEEGFVPWRGDVPSFGDVASRLTWGIAGWYAGAELGGPLARAISPYIPKGFGAELTTYGGPVTSLIGQIITAMENPDIAETIGTPVGALIGSGLFMKYGPRISGRVWNWAASESLKRLATSTGLRLAPLGPIAGGVGWAYGAALGVGILESAFYGTPLGQQAVQQGQQLAQQAGGPLWSWQPPWGGPPITIGGGLQQLYPADPNAPFYGGGLFMEPNVDPTQSMFYQKPTTDGQPNEFMKNWLGTQQRRGAGARYGGAVSEVGYAWSMWDVTYPGYQAGRVSRDEMLQRLAAGYAANIVGKFAGLEYRWKYPSDYPSRWQPHPYDYTPYQPSRWQPNPADISRYQPDYWKRYAQWQTASVKPIISGLMAGTITAAQAISQLEVIYPGYTFTVDPDTGQIYGSPSGYLGPPILLYTPYAGGISTDVTFTAGLRGQLYGVGGGWQGKPTGWESWDYAQKTAWIATHPGQTQPVVGPRMVMPESVIPSSLPTELYKGTGAWTGGTNQVGVRAGYGAGLPNIGGWTRLPNGRMVYIGGGAPAYSQGYNTPIQQVPAPMQGQKGVNLTRTVRRLINGKWTTITEEWDEDSDSWVEPPPPVPIPPDPHGLG